MKRPGNDHHLSQKLSEYKKQYSDKEKELKETIERLEREKEQEIQTIRNSFEQKKTNLSVIPIKPTTQQPSQYVKELQKSGDLHKAINQETDELNQNHFAKNRELEARIALLDKQCETRVAQVSQTHDEYITRTRKKGEKELAKINENYEKLKLYIARLNRR